MKKSLLFFLCILSTAVVVFIVLYACVKLPKPFQTATLPAEQEDEVHTSRTCCICGRTFDYQEWNDSNWQTIGITGMCNGCLSWQEHCRDERDLIEELYAKNNGYFPVDEIPGDRDIAVIFINDHTLQYVNRSDEVWSFGENYRLEALYADKWWYVNPIRNSNVNTDAHELGPGCTTYLYVDLSQFGNLPDGHYRLACGDIGDGHNLYYAYFRISYGVFYHDYTIYPEHTVTDHLIAVLFSFRNLQESEEYINADNDMRIELTYDLLDELATNGCIFDDLGYVISYPYPLIDTESIELVNNDNEIAFYINTIDGAPTVLEIWSNQK